MSATATTPVHRYVWEPAPAPVLPAHPSRELTGRRIAVVGGLDRTADRVSAELARFGAVPWRIGDPGVPDAVVDLTLAAPFDPVDAVSWEKPLLRTLATLRHCYDDWARESDCRRLGYLAVTYQGGHMGYGRTPAHQPLGGIWAGLAKTLHRELPNVNARIVDVDDPECPDLPGIVARELYRWGLCEVGYLGGVRHTLVPRARQAPPATAGPGPRDVVLVCGGGVGIGHALAVELARRHGCEVVVTGRRAAPDGTEEWLDLDEDGFDAYRRDLMRRAAAEGTLRETRIGIERLARQRELSRNLRAAAGEGLRVRYEACDLTDPVAVRALVAGLGPRLTGVVYIAGVDRPARLPAKADQDVLAGVAVKVTGFLRLFDAVRDRDLAFFCNAGSLTGRLGGMTGELDYAAGNEALARLGLWADRSAPFRTITACWPLWQRLSASTNVDAALRYMTALDPAQGLDLWCRELVSGSGEVTFLGRLGQALRPVQAAQFVVEHPLPGFDTAYPRIFHLGEPIAYRPPERLVTRVRFGADTVPAFGDFLVDDRPALPVSLLLESALRSAEWTVPEQGAPRIPSELRDVEVDLAALATDGGELVLDRETVAGDTGTTGGAGDGGGRWNASVVFRRPSDGAVVARMTVGYGEPDEPGLSAPALPVGEPSAPVLPTPVLSAPVLSAPEPSTPALPVPGEGEGTGAPPGEPAHPGLRRRGALIPAARWRVDPAGAPAGDVPPCWPADLWAADMVPAHRLPVAAVENIVGAAPGRGRRLRVSRVAVHADIPPADLVIGVTGVTGRASGRTWVAVDAGTARPVLTLHDPELGT
ncbi:KR domain-containing protein [Streptosporangium sp. NPDC023615]|uniref:KR domain-containing protein n=1 Tax=Streptosporangium sp. NPDC023615 TaxID=3154794 RepID=UPI00343C3976